MTATDETMQLIHQLAAILPPQGMWTEADYLWLTERTNRLVELADGRLEVLPMPTDQHQRIVLTLYRLLYTFLISRSRAGILLVAPLRLRLDSGRYREPDLLYLRSEDDSRRHNEYWEGADLVMEIVSPGNPNLDRVTKRREYALAGIQEYWIVDPQAEHITVLSLSERHYSEYGVFTHGQQAASLLLAGLVVDVTTVLHADQRI